ncbi:MAG: hypothetical protein AB2A00_10830 [Myxococcota bacterium]
MKSTKTRKARGYMLVEAMVAGGVLMASLGILMNELERARTMTTSAARGTEAKQLLEQGLQQAQVMGYAGTSSVAVENPVAGMAHRYKRELRPVGTGTETLAGTTGRAYRDVLVTVTWTSKGATKTQSATTRVYQ